MSDDEELTDDIVELLGETRQTLKSLERRVVFLERYLRDEGYGPDDLPNVDDDDYED